MAEIFKWMCIWLILGGSIYASVSLPPLVSLGKASEQKPQSVKPVAAAFQEGSPALPAAVPVSVPAPASTEATAGRFVVGNTDRVGVYIRRNKVDSDRIRPWMDGTQMVEVGPKGEVNGVAWRNVRDPAGNTGWIQERYLVPTGSPGTSAPAAAFATPSAKATPAPPTSTATAVPAESQLELLQAKLTRGYGFVMVEGQVKNAGGAALGNVVAVVSLLNAQGEPLQAEEQFVQSNPLPPGQTSPFKAVIITSAEANNYSVSFRQLSGGTIPTVDLRGR